MLRLLVCACLAVFALQQGAVPDGPPAQPATLRGRVVDKVTGAPLARAAVIVTRMRMNQTTQTLTNADGRFEFTGLAPDAYDLSATAGEFRASHVRHGPGAETLIQLKPGEVREVSIALIPALTISGRVVDQAGLPLSGARIQLRDFAMGNRSYGSQMRQTDDLGAFRIFGLPAGRYRVCAEANLSPKFGPAAGKRPVRFVTTCYPSAIDEAEAAPIVVSDSEVEGIEIRMQRQPTFTITGIVLDSTGSPVEPSMLGLMHIERNGGSGTGHRIHGSNFTLSNIVPGRYVVSAEIGPEPSPNSRPVEKGVVPVEITSADVENVVVAMRKAGRVRGAITYEDGPPPGLQVDRLQVEARHDGNEWRTGHEMPAPVGADLTFELKDLFGPYVLNVSGLPRATIVRAISYRGRDILDVPTEFDGDPGHTIDIRLTTRVAELSGRVLDDRGNPAAGARIMIFSADPARWRGTSRGAGMIGKDGAFRLAGLAAGDYLVVAISAEDLRRMEPGSWHDRAPWERLSKIAERITLLDNDRRIIDLTLRPLSPESRK